MAFNCFLMSVQHVSRVYICPVDTHPRVYFLFVIERRTSYDSAYLVACQGAGVPQAEEL